MSCSPAIKIEDTTVDKGGPSRQFLTDIFKQIEILSVEVGKERVKLFETSDSGVTVVTDELLEHNISLAMKRSGEGDAEVKAAGFKRAKDYVRAIGRVMLNSMANKFIIPANALPPFFMTGTKSFDFIINSPPCWKLAHFLAFMGVFHPPSDVSWI